MGDVVEISESDLRMSLRICIGMVKVPAKSVRLSEDQCDRITDAILAHLKRCGWRVMHEPVPQHSVRYKEPRRPDSDGSG